VENDLQYITAIYNQAIESRKSTADTEIYATEQRKQWFLSHNNERTPIIVYEENGTVTGFCYLSEYRAGRKALESVAEISYFVDFNHQRKGIGSRLAEHMINIAKELKYKNLLAILLSCNDGSIALLEKFGFELWGTLPDIVYIDNHVYSHCYYGLRI